MIEIRDVSFGYKKKSRLFDGLSLELQPGNIYGLLGKNGAGKSTLLKLIAGLVFPDHGELTVAGFQPKHRCPTFLNEIYLVTEEFDLPGIKIRDFVKYYAPFYHRFNHENFLKYIDEFKLDTEEKLSSLSYGQKKKFLLSFGLATDCKLLILDEPTNGLDIPSKSQFRKVVASAIHEERNFIISTHQVRDMENLIDPIIILDEGEVALFEDTESISSKLAFEKEKELPHEDELIYAETQLGGYTVVKRNIEKMDTNMNLEILFNAVINNREQIHQIFNGK